MHLLAAKPAPHGLLDPKAAPIGLGSLLDPKAAPIGLGSLAALTGGIANGLGSPDPYEKPLSCGGIMQRMLHMTHASSVRSETNFNPIHLHNSSPDDRTPPPRSVYFSGSHLEPFSGRAEQLTDASDPPGQHRVREAYEDIDDPREIQRERRQRSLRRAELGQRVLPHQQTRTTRGQS
jgi:hypothetical protein